MLRRQIPSAILRVGTGATLPSQHAISRRAASGPLLKYSMDFGTASPSAEFAAHAATASYEAEHRLKGGQVGVLDVLSSGTSVASCAVIAPGIVAASAGASAGELRGAGSLSTIAGPHTERVSAAPDSVQLLTVSSELTDPNVVFPSVRFQEGALVLACGHQADGTLVVAPGAITKEFDDDRQLQLDSSALPLGGVVLDMTNPKRFFGIAAPDGSVVSAKDPYFVINWVNNALPFLVPQQGRVNQLVMQYINDVKRTIMRNKDAIPQDGSMKLCNKIFVKNSLEDFKYNML